MSWAQCAPKIGIISLLLDEKVSSSWWTIGNNSLPFLMPLCWGLGLPGDQRGNWLNSRLALRYWNLSFHLNETYTHLEISFFFVFFIYFLRVQCSKGSLILLPKNQRNQRANLHTRYTNTQTITLILKYLLREAHVRKISKWIPK